MLLVWSLFYLYIHFIYFSVTTLKWFDNLEAIEASVRDFRRVDASNLFNSPLEI